MIMVKMMITCVATFTLCWLPFNLLIIVGDEYKEIYEYKDIIYVWFACHWLSMSHACYNPLIYIWMNGRFRDGFKYVFRFLPCIKRTQRPDFVSPHFGTSANSSAVKPSMRRLNTHLHKNGLIHSHIEDHKTSIV
ncbi:unnamed protein product [Medioppia subpectinata]|uniref:G-protein coupled receptors family 1 profile domain-containing protein n=1 Tax=Medioppia subpectinata TaxID=1979941 RepID=A0A7R9PUB0_9ACAR|nr:unnamed protein product [Medioppia subpectinata]CAG2100587.1 unnamed protein product [Medioppia subpectinata]